MSSDSRKRKLDELDTCFRNNKRDVARAEEDVQSRIRVDALLAVINNLLSEGDQAAAIQAFWKVGNDEVTDEDDFRDLFKRLPDLQEEILKAGPGEYWFSVLSEDRKDQQDEEDEDEEERNSTRSGMSYKTAISYLRGYQQERADREARDKRVGDDFEMWQAAVSWLLHLCERSGIAEAKELPLDSMTEMKEFLATKSL